MSNWVKGLAKICVEAALENGLTDEDLSSLSSSFAGATVELISERDEQNDDAPIIPGLNFDYLEENDNLTLDDKINLGQNYAPTKTAVLQQLSVGLGQGYFGHYDFVDGLTKNDFDRFAKPDSSPNPINNGKLESNIITGFYNGLMDKAVGLGETKEVFIYDAVKASANGFLTSTTVASTSKAEYLDQFLYLDAAEMISKQVSQSVILHNTVNGIQPDSVVSYSVAQDWIEVDRVAESAASGAAMGSQLATVLPKSMEYADLGDYD